MKKREGQRPSVKRELAQALADARWLVERGDFEGAGQWLEAMGLAKGSSEFDAAMQALKQMRRKR